MDEERRISQVNTFEQVRVRSHGETPCIQTDTAENITFPHSLVSGKYAELSEVSIVEQKIMP